MNIERRHISKLAKISAGGVLMLSSFLPQPQERHVRDFNFSEGVPPEPVPVAEPLLQVPDNQVILQPGVIFIVGSRIKSEITPPPTPGEDRTSCNEIKGTNYYSPSEREFYLDNCIVKEIPKQQQTETQNQAQAQTPQTTYSPSRPAAGWADVVCGPEFTWDCSWAIATIDCESSGNPNAVNPAGPFNGLFQNLNGPFDPYQNAVEAHIKYVQWKKGIVPDPWPNCPRNE